MDTRRVSPALQEGSAHSLRFVVWPVTAVARRVCPTLLAAGLPSFVVVGTACPLPDHLPETK